MRCVVTGAAGFIGAEVCLELLRRPEVDEVVALDDGSSGDFDSLHGLPVRTVCTSVTDADALARHLADADAVIALASRWFDGLALAEPLSVYEVNLMGVLMTLHTAHACGAATVLCPPPCGGPRDANDTVGMAVRSAAETARSCFGARVAVVELPEVVGVNRPLGHPLGGWVERAARGRAERRSAEVLEVGAAARHLVDAASDLVGGVGSPDRVVAGRTLTVADIRSRVARLSEDPTIRGDDESLDDILDRLVSGALEGVDH